MIVFRRILAGFLVFLFILASLPTFAVFSLSNTYLNPKFYSGKVVDGTYDFLVTFTAKNLHVADPIIEEKFTEIDLKREIEKVFPRQLFSAMAEDVTEQLETFQKNPSKPVALSLKKFRDSLVTLSHDLSYMLFESFRRCDEGEFPEDDVRGLPTCVPEGVEYNLIAAPFASQFETAIYNSVPEQIQLDLFQAAGGQNGTAWIQNFDSVRLILYVILVLLLVGIAFLVYAPFSLIVFYEGFAFLISGVMGYFMAFGFGRLPQYLLENITADDPAKRTTELSGYLQYLFGFIIDEMQKVSLTFIALGAVLLLVRFFMIRHYKSEQLPLHNHL